MTAHAEIDFDLDNASPAAGAVKKKCHDIGRKIEDELGAQASGGPAVRSLGDAARAVEPAADLYPAARADQGEAHLMTVFQGAVDATFATFGVEAVYTPAGGDPVTARVIARRPDTIVGFGETRIYTETATFEVRASGVATRARATRSPSVARLSSFRASRSGATLIDLFGL